MGAPNIVTTGFVPELWNSAVLRTKEDNLILKKIFRATPLNVANGKADTVYFSGLADPTVNDYNGSLTFEDLADDTISLKLDKDIYVAFKVNNLDQAMATADLKGSQANRAGYVINRKIERDAFQYIYDKATAGTITDTTFDSSTAISVLTEACVKLEEANVFGEKFLVVTPAIKAKMVLAGIAFSINEGINGKGTMEYAKHLGFDIFVSNTIYTNGGVHHCVAGSMDSLAYADVMLETRTHKLQGSRDSGIDMEVAYGYEVIRPKELVRLDLTPIAETSL